MADFIIRIPRVSVAVSEAELLEFLVEAGQQVEEGAVKPKPDQPRNLGTKQSATDSEQTFW